MAPATPLLAAVEIQTGVMARSLAIALAIVAPFGVRWWRQQRRNRATPEDEATAAAEAGPAAPTLEALIDEISSLAPRRHRRGASDEDGDGDGDGSVTITVPRGLTIDGDPAPGPIVDAIVRDALQRSGFVPTAELDTGSARVIECRPRTDR